MDVNALEAFVSVAETGSFTLAAHRLHLTQPAVSKRIALLESELDARLFDRIGRAVTLTEAGRVLLPNARRILVSLDDTRRALSNLSGSVRGPLGLATSHHIALHRLPPVLRSFIRHHPAVRLDMKFLDSEAGCQAVQRGEAELAIVTLPPAPPAGLDVRTLWEDPLVMVAATGHPLCRRRPPAPEALRECTGILPGTGTFTRDIIDDALQDLGIGGAGILETNYLETIRMLVEVGAGWAVLPRTMLAPGMCQLPFPARSMRRLLGMAWHRERTLSNAARALIAMLAVTDHS